MDLRERMATNANRHQGETVRSAFFGNRDVCLDALEHIEVRIPDFSVWTICHGNPVVAAR